MNNLAKEEKASFNIFLVVAFTYTVICMTKAAFSASIVGIVADGLFTKSRAGIINGSFFLFYGAGQLFGGRIVDKVSPYKMILVAVSGALLSITAMSLSSNFYTMLLIWSFSGLIQFGMWPAVVRIISQFMLPEHKKKAMTYIACSSTAGVLIGLICASSLIGTLGWRWLFYLYSLVLILTLLIWFFGARTPMKILSEARKRQQTDSEVIEEKSENVSFIKLVFVSGLAILLLPTLIRQMLSTLSTWVPTLIKETYGVSASFATALNIIISIVNLSGVFLINYFYPKRIKNVMVVYALCFTTIIPLTVALTLTGKISVWIIIALLCMVTTLACGAAQCINVITPTFFAKYNRAGSVAGLINALGSFGSVTASTCFGIMADKVGWTGTIISWIILAIIATAFSACAIPFWKKFTQEN